MLGAVIGTLARADEWFRPRRKFPWPKRSPPPNISDSISWLALQERLLAFGYTRGEIEKLYGKWKSSEKMTDILAILVTLPSQPVDVPPFSLLANIQKTSSTSSP